MDQRIGRSFALQALPPNNHLLLSTAKPASAVLDKYGSLKKTWRSAYSKG